MGIVLELGQGAKTLSGRSDHFVTINTFGVFLLPFEQRTQFHSLCRGKNGDGDDALDRYERLKVLSIVKSFKSQPRERKKQPILLTIAYSHVS